MQAAYSRGKKTEYATELTTQLKMQYIPVKLHKSTLKNPTRKQLGLVKY